MIGNRMAITAKAPREEMMEFIGQHIDSPTKLELLLFWSKYRYSKFTSGVIAQALACNRADMEEALESFIKAEVVEKHIWQGLPFYSLTTNRDKRQGVLSLWERLNYHKEKHQGVVLSTPVCSTSLCKNGEPNRKRCERERE